MRHLRALVRNVMKIRLSTGASELVILWQFLSKIDPFDTATTVVPKCSADRSAAFRLGLVEAEGGSLSATEVAEALGISKAEVFKRYREVKLVAWREGRQKQLRFPRWQFHRGKVLEGFEQVLANLTAGGVGDFDRLGFFICNALDLGGSRPVDCLRKGELTRVVQLVEAWTRNDETFPQDD